MYAQNDNTAPPLWSSTARPTRATLLTRPRHPAHPHPVLGVHPAHPDHHPGHPAAGRAVAVRPLLGADVGGQHLGLDSGTCRRGRVCA